MTKIYVVSKCWDYEGCDIIKAFYDENKARELHDKIENMSYDEKMKNEMWCDYASVEEVYLE